MNDTLLIQFFPIMHIIGRNFLCSSIMTILLTFVIRCNLIMWYVLWFTIIIGGTGCFMITTIPICFIFNWVVLLIISKYSQKRKIINKTWEKKLNSLYIFQFEYYWPACEKKNSLPIDEKYLFNTGPVPTIWILTYPHVSK